jgi:peptidoglycan/xylan/chitin deacetylase (PgdA/CDA1 family)
MIRPVIHPLPPPDDARERPGVMARLQHKLATHLPVSPFNATSDTPSVSFTFDDVPVSAATAGADLLEEHGARATFYVAGGMLDAKDDHWQVVGPETVVELHARGHEIGCHSHSHVRADRMTATQMQADILRNRALLKNIEPSLPLKNFAYPYGLSTLAWKNRLKKHFRSSRGIRPCLNEGLTDAQYLHAVPLIDREIDEERIDRIFAETARKKAWLIFYSHDVAARPSDYGCSPGLLRHALRSAQRFGLKIETVNVALSRIGQIWLLAMPLI